MVDLLYSTLSFIEDIPVLLINYYTPNEEKDQLKVLDDLNNILDNIDASEDTVPLWGGDFNLIFDIRLDTDGGSLKLKSKPFNFFALTKIKVRLRRNSEVGCFQGYLSLHQGSAQVNAYGLGQVRHDKIKGLEPSPSA